MAPFPQKLTSSAQPDASYARFFLSCVDVCQVRGPNAIESICKEPDTTLSGSRGLAVVTEPNSSCVPGSSSTF